nr:MFS transporter [uncultured Noviherbaspirillum sp.]
MSVITRPAALLLNVGHALDHLFLLIFAAAVTSIAAEFGFEHWEDLMPYGVGAFFLFGLGSLPSGRLGDLWGRRAMMVVFFIGLGSAALLTACVQNAWQLAGALMLLGLFASIYHPVGIPMLVQGSRTPGAVIGINGLAGNLGVAAAALLTGFLIKESGWRAAFIVPGLFSVGCGIAFARLAPAEAEAPAKRAKTVAVRLPAAVLARIFLVMTTAAVSGSMLFNFSTNGNERLLAERLQGIINDPAQLGMLLAGVYAVASLAQVVVGRLIDRFPLKRLYLCMVGSQVPLLALAAHATGWSLYTLLLAVMIFIFGAIPFTDAMVVRYVDDDMRSRVAGMRLSVSFGISSLAVWLLGPVVKSGGFSTLLLIMAGISLFTTTVVFLMPGETALRAAAVRR